MTVTPDIELVDPGAYEDGGVPHGQLAWLREHDPVHRHHGDAARGYPPFWAVTRHEDVVHVSRHPELFSSWRRLALFDEPDEEHLVLQRMMMLNQDPPEHTRKRGIVNRGFTPRAIAALEEHVRDICRTLVAETAERGEEADFVRDLAAPLPLYVICELLGAPPEDREKIFHWSNTLIGGDDPEFQRTPEEGQAAAAELYAYANVLAADRRENPRDDIVTRLLEPGADGEVLSGDEFELFVMLLSVAGNETTRNAASGGMLALLEHPEHSRDRLNGGDLPPPPGLTVASAREVTTTVDVRPEVRNMSFLPVPYAPSNVSIKGDWRVHSPSLMIYSLRDSAGGRSYTVKSVRAEPTSGQLSSAGAYPAEVVSRYTAVPRNIPRQVRQLAQDVTDGSSTALAQAVKLQRWFTRDGGFTYDLSAPAPQHGSDLVDFLLHSKRGYCEQYAASMALMARIIGIPSRVAMGYTPGSEVRPGEWVVRSRDAHAWPELYFQGTGWVRFEPTPSGVAGQGTADAPAYSLPEVAAGGGPEDRPAPAPESSSPEEDDSASPGDAAQHRSDAGPEGAAAAEEGEEDGFSVAPWLAGGLLVVLLMAVPMMLRALTRRRRWDALAAPRGPEEETRRRSPGRPPGKAARAAAADPAEAAHVAWREMRADALDHGLEWRSSDSPRATARRLGELLELDQDGARALTRIARAEELARYSPSPSPEPPERLRADVRAVREAFAASVGRRARLRARLLPPSTVAQTRESLRSAADRAAELAARLNDLPGRLRRR